MVSLIPSGLGSFTTSPPRLPGGNVETPATSGFDEAAVLVDVQAALRPEAPAAAGTLSPKGLLASLIDGFATAARADRALNRVFAAINTRVQTSALDFLQRRSEALQQSATILTLLGKTPDSVAEEAESLARQADDKAGKTQNAMLREQRLGPLSSLAERIARFRRLDETLDGITSALRITSFIHRADAEGREDDEAAGRSENRVERSLRDIEDLKSDLDRYRDPPTLNLTV